MLELSSDYWDKEAYVSLHLVQSMLEKAGLPRKCGYSHWIPEFPVQVPRLNATGDLDWAQKRVDFLVEDLNRNLNFLIEIKMEYLSVYAIRSPIKRAKEIQEDMNKQRGIILGIVPMMIENVNLHTTIKQLVQRRFRGITILPEIKRSTYIGQASYLRQPVSLFAERNNNAGNVAIQFANLTKEIVKKINKIESSVGG